MRVAMGVKKDFMGEVIINQLFKHTQMQNSFGIIFLAVVNNRPQLLTLKEILEHFILHRKEIIVRRTIFDLKKAEALAHILEGYKIALDNLDEVVALIRKSKTPAEAKDGLMSRFALSEIQAREILNMRLQRLTGLERDKIIEDYNNVLKDIEWFNEILASERIVLGIVKDELNEINEEYGDERKTRIVEATAEISIEDLIEEEDMAVTISKSGYIKRNPITLYNSQRRGGKGKMAMGTKDDDFVEHLFVASTHHMFLFFTNLGRVYWSKVYELPIASRTSKGRAIVNFLNFAEGEKLTTVMAVPSFEEGKNIIMATKKGLIKKTDLMAYSRPRLGGIIAINLNPGDELVAVRITSGDMDVFMGSYLGKAIRFHESNARQLGRVSKGVRGLRLGDDDYIVSLEVLSHGATLFAVTENGYGKRTLIDEYPVRNRGGKGVISIKTTERNGNVAAILLVEDGDDLMLMTNKGKLIRMKIEGISVISRNTQGVRLIGLSKDETVIGAARIAESDEDDDEFTDELTDDAENSGNEPPSESDQETDTED